jgi:type II secretory ATPase GspE/PulE/Tfp pilus assembly ATPase PilB-like protein
LIGTHDPYTQNVQTLEEEIESEMEGVRHERIPPEMDDAAYNQRIKALLMREVAVMYVGKIANQQTVQMIADAADEVRFYVGLRQEDTFAALKAWSAAIGDPRTAANSLGGIVAQRLVRKLCTTCRVPYQPSADALRKINLPPDKVKQLFKHSGKVQVKDQIEPCPTCHGMGFQGMVPVFEVMPIDDAARKLIAAEEMDQLRSLLRRQGMLWLQEAALARAVEGVTSINEITRAMSRQQAS